MSGRVKSWRDIGNPQRRQAGRRAAEEAAARAAVPATPTAQPTLPSEAQYKLPSKNPILDKTGSLPKPVAKNAPKPKPWMALDVDKNGQAVYGTGLSGWARKAWADLTDPSKYFYDLNKISKDKQEAVNKEFEESKALAGKVIESKLKWSQWGEKMFGIKAEELGTMGALGEAERTIAKEAGENVAGTAASRVVRLGVDTTQNFVWGGLAILGMGDQAMRKIHSARQGLDAVADKFNRDEDTNFVSKIVAGNVGVIKDVITVANAVNDGKLTWSDTKETIGDYAAGSEMAYSMIFADSAKAQFEKGLAEGRDPIVLAQDYGSLGIELAGSILGDPTTYLGLSLVRPVNIFTKVGRESGNLVNLGTKISFRVPWKTIAKIPTFGEIIGANVGKTRFAKESTRFIDSAVPGLEKALGKSKFIAGETDALKVGQEAVKSIVDHYSTAPSKLEAIGNVLNKGKVRLWSLASLDSTGRLSATARDASLFLGNLVAERGLDTTMRVLRDMGDLRNADRKVAEAAAQRLLPYGSSVFSHVGELVGEVISKMADSQLDDILKKNDNAIDLHNQLFKKLERVLDEYVPSVDDMMRATDAVKDARKAGKVLDDKTLRLAEMYEDVDPVVKTIRNITRVPENIAKGTSGLMVKTFMAFVPRSWVRNTQGAILPMASRIGLWNAIDIAATSFLGIAKKTTDNVLGRVNDDIIKTLGFDVLEDGIAKQVGSQNYKVFGVEIPNMLNAIRNSESIMGRRIILQAVKDTINSALPAVVKDLPEWDNFVNALPKEQQALPFAAMQRAYGNVDEAAKILRNWVGKGEIEAWKLVEPPEAMRKYLEDQNLLTAFREAQENAKSSDEFKTIVTDYIGKFKKAVTDAKIAEPTQTTVFNTHTGFGADLVSHTKGQQQEIFKGLYQSWHNTEKQLVNVEETVMRKVYSMANDMAMKTGDKKLFQKVQEFQAELNANKGLVDSTWDTVDQIRNNFVKGFREVENLDDKKSMVKFFQQTFEAGTTKFNLSKVYPQANFATMTRQQFKQMAWSAYFEFASDMYRKSNVQKFDDNMGILENVAKLFKSNLDDLAGANQSGENVFNVLMNHYKEAQQFEEAHAWQRFFRQLDFDPDYKKADGTQVLLKDVVGKFTEIFPDWKGGQTHIVNAVNADMGRKAIKANKPIAPKFGQSLGKMIDKTTSVPRSELPKPVSERIAIMAKQLLGELRGGEAKGFTQSAEGGTRFGSTNAKWYSELYKDKKLGKPQIEAAIDRIIQDAGKDKGKAVETVKEEIMGILLDGGNGQPPDLYVLQQLGAPDEMMQDALKTFNEMTGKKSSLDEALQSMGAPVSITDETMPYYDDAGNLVQPGIKYEDITLQQALTAIGKKYIPAAEAPGLVDELNETNVLFRGLDGVENDVNRWSEAVTKEWGITQKTVSPKEIPDFENLLQNMKKAVNPRMEHVRMEAAVTGLSTRNFALHDYDKTYLDHGMSLLMGNSFHYWTTRTYARTLETLVESPKYANMYMSYKEYNVKRHSDQPDWYRQNIQFDSILGIPLKNPYFVNLEAAINPMYGLTGVDFNDPRKRVDWMSRMVDDMNKMGPSFSPLVSYAIGLRMFNKGETEAGQRWFGRMLPQTSLIKSATGFMGKPIELDPWVQLLDGGVDPYEQNRVAAALANMVRNGEITQEEMIDAGYKKEGEIWEKGVQASAEARFGSDATSFFFGAGLRPRTQYDMVIEKFWGDYSTMVASRSMMSPDQYRQAWDNMRDNPEYGGFMEALLLTRKSGGAMDTAYAYNVFGRIPPGELNDVSKIVGIRPDMIQDFYDAKGDFTKMGWTEQDKNRFMAGAVDIAAVYKIPSNATRQDWSDAKDQYKQMNEMLLEKFGEKIVNQMSDFYGAENKGDYLDAHPQVEAALQFKDGVVSNNSKLLQYYGGIETLERYYTTKMENELEKTYPGIKEIEEGYYDLLTSKERSAYKRQHPELKDYWADKAKAKDALFRRITVLGENLPDKKPSELRGGDLANAPQESLAGFATPKPEKSYNEWRGELGEPTMELISDYWYDNKKLPKVLNDNMDYLAKEYGYYDGDELLQAVIQTMPQR